MGAQKRSDQTYPNSRERDGDVHSALTGLPIFPESLPRANHTGWGTMTWSGLFNALAPKLLQRYRFGVSTIAARTGFNSMYR